MATKEETSSKENQQNSGEPSTPLTVNAQFLKDLSYECSDPVKTFQTMESAPEINVSVDIQATPLKENSFEVALKISAEATNKGEKAYVVEVEYGGVFSLGADVPEEAKHPLLMIECPRLLFPFARSVIADATREGGFPPLSLVPIDFVALYRQQIERQQKNQEGTSKTATT
tara:strand:- start:1806 stop:2321 length:516 start_codon:yes stop_codon:yes gene_type:complete